MSIFKKHISIVLLTVIFLNSVICCPIYAEPIFEDNAVAEDIFDSENTECALETTTISNIPDEVESSSGIITDIIGSINDVFENAEVDNNKDVIEVEDTVLSDAALDFELDTSEMTEEVKDLLNGKKPYKKLSQYEKYLLMEQVGVREDTMTECEEANYSILESIPIALIMQRMCFNLNDALKMIQTHQSETSALEETNKFISKSYECGFMNNEIYFYELTALIRDGYKTDETLNAFVVSKILNQNISEVIKKKSDTVALDNNAVITSYVVADNWFMNIPYLMDKDGNAILDDSSSPQKPMYITLGNGESYALKYEPMGAYSFRYKALYCYNDELYLYSDNNNSFGVSTDKEMQSKYKLRHKDGKYDYFNGDGLWLGTTDRFGNTIRLLKEKDSNDNRQYKIIDTKKNAVIITRSGGRISSITTPDDKTFTINYGVQTAGTKNKNIIASYKDGANNTTIFEYEFLEDDSSHNDSYSNALITCVTLPSELKYQYEYELGDIARYNRNANDKEKYYPRVNTESIDYDNVLHKQKQITYSTFNYTDANLNLLVSDQDTFTYYVTEVENGISTGYQFDVFDRIINSKSNYDINDTTNYKTIEYTYNDSINFGITNPNKIKTTENKGSISNKKVEIFEYSRVGDVTTYIVEQNNKKLHEEYHQNSWNGNADRYNLDTKVEYINNNNEKITVTNTLSNFNKTIGSTTITNSNNEILGHSEFIYNPYTAGGQLSVKKEFINYDPNKNEYYNPHKYTVYSYSENLNGDEIPESAPISVTTYIKECEEYDESFKVEYAYDVMGRKIEEKHDNSITKYEYNALGDPIKESYSDKYGNNTVSKTYTYNYAQNTCTIKDENGNSILYDFDPAGKLFKVSQGNNILASYTYNNRMLPATFKDGNAVTTYTYDNRDRLIQELTKDGSTQLIKKGYTYEINATGLLTKEILYGNATSNSITNIIQNDIMDRPVTKNTAGTIVNYEYDMMNNVTKESNYISQANDETVYLVNNYTYDYMGNVLTKTVAENTVTNNNGTDNVVVNNAVTTSATYDMLGRMTTSTDAKGNTTSYLYNALDQVIEKEMPFDSTGNTFYYYVYDSLGNLKEERVTDGITNKYEYDYRNRLITAISGSNVTTYKYDNVGNMTEFTSGGHTHKYRYDNLNRVKEYIDVLNQSETYTYNSHNDMIKKVDRNGKTTTYTYDALHRMLTEKADGVNNSWIYSMTGTVKSESNANASKTYTYNNKGLVSTENTTIGDDTFTIQRYYDTRGNNTVDKYLKNNNQYQQLNYTYDSRNRLRTVNVPGGESNVPVQKAWYGYDVNDNLVSANYGNNTKQAYYYNAANYCNRIDLINKSNSAVLEHFTYNYRKDGNLISKTEKIGGNTNTVQYSYNTEGRLYSETYNGADNFSINYTYDNAGNRKTASFSGEDVLTYTESYTYDANNRLTNMIESSPYWNYKNITNYTYDKNGNQKQITKNRQNNDDSSSTNMGTQTFTYNGLNQLIGYENTKGSYNGQTGLNANYIYMANGYRLSKTVNGKTTKYLWDGDNVDSELDSQNTVTNRYYRGNYLVSDNTETYYIHNLHGDIVETYKGTSMQHCFNYKAFGYSGGFNDMDMPINWGYCDQLYDFETGNYYMRTRYYNPEIGRFINEDPIKDGVNWYSYCGENPIIYKDTNGLYRIYKNNNPNNIYLTYEAKPTGYLDSSFELIYKQNALTNDLYCLYLRNIRNMECSNSVNYSDPKDFLVDGTGIVFDKFKERLGKDFSKVCSKVATIYGVVTTIGDIVNSIDTISTDDVVFKLFEMAGIGTYSSDLGYLMSVMNKAYEFVSQDISYFFGPEILAGKNMFQIDYEIYTSDNPSRTKENFIRNFNASNPNLPEIDKISFEGHVNSNWKRNDIVNAFKEYVKG